MAFSGRMLFLVLSVILATACNPGLPPGCGMVTVNDDSEAQRLDCSAQPV